MYGRYRIPLGLDELPEENPRIQALLKSLDPGAAYTLKIWEEPLALDSGNARAVPVGSNRRSRQLSVEATRYVEIWACGGKARRRKPSTTGLADPPVPTLESLCKRLTTAQAALQLAKERLSASLRNQWRPEGWEDGDWQWRKVTERKLHRRIGQTVGRILARHNVHAGAHVLGWWPEDYRDLDEAVGRKVERASKVGRAKQDRADGYLGWIVKTYTGSYRYGHKREAVEPMEQGSNAIQSYLEVKANVPYLEELVRLVQEREGSKVTPAPVQSTPTESWESISSIWGCVRA
jgi:hypothetical protein